MRLATTQRPTPVGLLPGRIIAGAGFLLWRIAVLLVFLLLSLAEPFLAVMLGGLSLACFFVAVLFGFILHAPPFEHRWFVLGASIALLGLYVLYRWIMLGVERLLR